jgi:hypothetical protein
MGNGNVSVAKAGWTGGSSFGGWGVWGRDDMDGVSWWDARDVSIITTSRQLLTGPLPFQFTLECTVPSLRVATEPSTSPSWETDYLVEVLPNLPVSSTGHVRGCLLGNNRYEPSSQAIQQSKSERSIRVFHSFLHQRRHLSTIFQLHLSYSRRSLPRPDLQVWFQGPPRRRPLRLLRRERTFFPSS